MDRSIIDEYEITRSRKRSERDRRVDEIYSRFPRLAEIKREKNIAGAANISSVLSNPSEADRLNAQLKQRLAELDAEKDRIIRENGIDPDFEQIRYECEKCRDTGFIGQKKCSCYTKKLIEKAYTRSNLGELLKTQSFDKFNPEYYPDTAENGGESAREHMNMVCGRCLAFCDDFDKMKKGLLFYGGAGLGKTFLSSCIAGRLLDRGYDVIYITASRLFTICDEIRFGRGDIKTNRAATESFMECDLLIIDDLGTESATRYTESYLFDVVNERIMHGKKMIISTNYSMEALSAAYTTRITSRLYENFNFLHFVGNDIRIAKQL